MPATYDSIATTTLGAGTSSFSFSSIPSGYTDLRIAFRGTGSQTMYIILNSDTGANYSWTFLIGNSSTASSNGQNAQSSGIELGTLDGVNGNPTASFIDIFSYSGSIRKACLVSTVSDRNSTTGSSSVRAYAGLWQSTAAINNIQFTTNGTFNAGTIVTLYGILRA